MTLCRPVTGRQNMPCRVCVRRRAVKSTQPPCARRGAARQQHRPRNGRAGRPGLSPQQAWRLKGCTPHPTDSLQQVLLTVHCQFRATLRKLCRLPPQPPARQSSDGQRAPTWMAASAGAAASSRAAALSSCTSQRPGADSTLVIVALRRAGMRSTAWPAAHARQHPRPARSGARLRLRQSGALARARAPPPASPALASASSAHAAALRAGARCTPVKTATRASKHVARPAPAHAANEDAPACPAAGCWLPKVATLSPVSRARFATSSDSGGSTWGWRAVKHG